MEKVLAPFQQSLPPHYPELSSQAYLKVWYVLSYLLLPKEFLRIEKSFLIHTLSRFFWPYSFYCMGLFLTMRWFAHYHNVICIGRSLLDKWYFGRSGRYSPNANASRTNDEYTVNALEASGCTSFSVVHKSKVIIRQY